MSDQPEAGTLWERRLHQFIADAMAQPETEREAWIRANCGGDTELQREALSFMGDLDKADGFLVTPLAAGPVGESYIGREFGPFRLLEVLGEGGMGIVFKASQSRPVQRTVALKIIRGFGSSRPLRERFQKEQQILAMLNHPGIAAVYQCGEGKDGTPFFVMEYVEGHDIRTYCSEKKPRGTDLLKLILQICEALHYAHGKGIVHRDLKPSNILVGAGVEPVIKLIDFGVAAAHFEDIADPNLTQTGMLLGTPAYMSPEQAEGEAIDRRTDVYALGALVYELFSGTPPLDFGENPSFPEIRRVIREKIPRPLEAGSVGGDLRGRLPDLNAVLGKALQKDARHRYQSAGEMAADFQRIIHEEPLEIEGPSSWYRLRKALQLRKQWALGVAVFLSLLLAFHFGVTAFLTARAVERRLAVVGGFAMEAERIASDLRQTYFLPLHDTRPARANAAAAAKTLEMEMIASGPETLAAGRFALGRIYFALESYETAILHLHAAEETGVYQEKTKLYLGLCYAERYEQALSRARFFPGEAQRRLKREAERKWLIPARDYLAEISPHKEEDRVYLQALVAYLNGDLDRASALLIPPDNGVSFYKSDLLAGRILLEQGSQLRTEGKPEAADAAFEAAALRFAKAFESARGLPQAWERAAELIAERMNLRWTMAGIPMAAWSERALDFLEKAESAEPGRDRGLLLRNRIYLQWAVYERDRGRSPIALLDEMETECFQGGTDLVQTVLYQKAMAATVRGRWLFTRGKDSEPAFQRAHEAVLEALRYNPENLEMLLLAGDISNNHGAIGIATNDPNTADYLLQARDAFQRAVNLDPEDHRTHTGLGNSWFNWARYQKLIGEDPVTSFEFAEAYARVGVDLNPGDVFTLTNSGLHHMVHGQHLGSEGEDPTAALDQAVSLFLRAYQVNPEHPKVSLYLGTSLAAQARYGHGCGEDGAEDPAILAIPHYLQALALKPSPITYNNFANCLFFLHRRLYPDGDPGSPLLLEARHTLDLGFAIKGDSALLTFNSACFWTQMGRFEEARQDLKQLEILNPRFLNYVEQDGCFEPLRQEKTAYERE